MKNTRNYTVLATDKETFRNFSVIDYENLENAMNHAEWIAREWEVPALVMLKEENKLLAKYTEKGSLLIY